MKLAAPIFFVTAIILFFPMWINGVTGYDTQYHVPWSKAFSAAFWNGDLYPRWLPTLNAGCGYHLFYFYPPLAYYAAAFFEFLRTPLNDTYPLIAVLTLVNMLAGIACYSLLRERISQNRAIFFSVVYQLCPAIWADAYIRFFFTYEFIYAIVPYVILQCNRFSLNKPYAFLGIVSGLVISLLSSLPGAILIFYFTAFYLALIAWEKKSIMWLLRSSVAFPIAIGITSFYVLPMAMSYTEVYQYTHNSEGRFGYENNLLIDINSGKLSTGEWRASLTIFAYMIILGIVYRPGIKKYEVIKRYFISFIIAVLFVTPVLLFLVNLLPLFNNIQYSVRLMVFISLLFSLLCALSKEDISKKDQAIWILPLLLIVFYTDIALQKSYAPAQVQGINYNIEGEITTTGRAKEEGILQYNMGLDPHAIFFSKTFDYFDGKGVWVKYSKIKDFVGFCRAKVTKLEGDADVRISTWEDDSFSLRVKVFNETSLRIGKIFLPGFWNVSITPSNGAYYNSDGTGMLKVTLAKPGDYKITAKFQGSSYGNIAALISMLSVCIVIILFFKERRFRANKA